MSARYSDSDGGESGSEGEGRSANDRERNDLFSDEEGQQRSGGGSGKEENKDDKAKKAPKKKKTGPVKRMMLSEDELTGRNGLMKLDEIFKEFKFRGKGYEKQDLDQMLYKYEHWCHVMHPKYPFAQVLERIEFLGVKNARVKVHMKKIRMGLINGNTADDSIVPDEMVGNSDDERENVPNQFASSHRNNDEIDSDIEERIIKPSASKEFNWDQHNQNQDDGFPDDEDDALFAALDTGEGFDAGNDYQTPDGATTNTSSAKKLSDSNGKSSDIDEDNVVQRKQRAPKKAVINSDDSDEDDRLLSKVPPSTAVVPSPTKSNDGKPSQPEISDDSSSSTTSSSASNQDSVLSVAFKLSSDSSNKTAASRKKFGPGNTKPALNSSGESDEDHLLLSKNANSFKNLSREKSSHSQNSQVPDNSKGIYLSNSNTKTKQNGTRGKKQQVISPKPRISYGKRRRVTNFDDDDDEDENKLVTDMGNNSDNNSNSLSDYGSDTEAGANNKNSQPNKSKRLRLESSDEDEDGNSTRGTIPDKSESPREKRVPIHRRRVISDDSGDE